MLSASQNYILVGELWRELKHVCIYVKELFFISARYIIDKLGALSLK